MCVCMSTNPGRSVPPCPSLTTPRLSLEVGRTETIRPSSTTTSNPLRAVVPVPVNTRAFRMMILSAAAPDAISRR